MSVALAIFWLFSLLLAWACGYVARGAQEEEAVYRACRDRDIEVLDECLAAWGRERRR